MREIIDYSSAIAAIVALFITVWQMRLSNKQALFEKRTKIFMDSMGFIELYKKNEDSINNYLKEKEPLWTIDFLMSDMTNNSYLNVLMLGFSDPLGKHHREFLIKLEEIKKLSLEIELAFNGINSIELSKFIIDYQELLFSLYQYKIRFEKIKDLVDTNKKSFEDASDMLKEEDERENVIKKLINLRTHFDFLIKENAMDLIKREIKL